MVASTLGHNSVSRQIIYCLRSKTYIDTPVYETKFSGKKRNDQFLSIILTISTCVYLLLQAKRLILIQSSKSLKNCVHNYCFILPLFYV